MEKIVCKVCGGEVVDDKCPNCDKMRAMAKSMAAEELKKLAGEANDKTAGAKEAVKPSDKENLHGMLKALSIKRRDLAEAFCDERQKDFTGSGYLIPTEYSDQIYSLFDEYGVARRLCDVYPVGTNSVEVPKITTGFTMQVIGSDTHRGGSGGSSWKNGTRKPTTAPTIGQIVGTIREVAAVFPVKKNTLSDTNTNFETRIPELFARAAALGEDNILFNGEAFAGTTAMGGLIEKGEAVTGSGIALSDITIADVIKMQSELQAAALIGARYFMSPSVRVQLWQNMLTAGWAGRMSLEEALGLPIELVNALPSAGDVEDNTAIIVLGNLANVYLFDREQLSIDVSESATLFDSAGANPRSMYQDNEVAFRAVERIDIQVKQDDAFAVLGTAEAS